MRAAAWTRSLFGEPLPKEPALFVETISLGKDPLERIKALGPLAIIRGCAAAHPVYGKFKEAPLPEGASRAHELGLTLENPDLAVVYKVRPGAIL